MNFPDLSDLAPIIAAAIFGGLFAFHTAPNQPTPPQIAPSEVAPSDTATLALALPQR